MQLVLPWRQPESRKSLANKHPQWELAGPQVTLLRATSPSTMMIGGPGARRSPARRRMPSRLVVARRARPQG